MTARRAAPHPGMACCDPAQDLAGWIARQRAALAETRAEIRELHADGERLAAQATESLLAGDDREAAAREAASRAAHGQANALAQSALIREGHLDRVAAAHAWRLGDQPAVGAAS